MARIEVREGVVDEAMRLLPPRRGFAVEDTAEVRVPWELLAAVARGSDSAAASHAMTILGWDDVPECVASLLAAVDAEFLVVANGLESLTTRWWVSGDAGWVGLGLTKGEVRLVPSSPEDIRRALIVDVAAAFGRS